MRDVIPSSYHEHNLGSENRSSAVNTFINIMNKKYQFI